MASRFSGRPDAREAEVEAEASTPSATSTSHYSSSAATPTEAYQRSVYTQTTSRAVTESESLARDIKEGTLTGFVGNGTTLTGEASFKGMLRVDGGLSGRVSSADGTLIVSTNGRVDANVEVAVAQIFGTVNGDITATKRIEMGRVAKVTGNIQTPALVIENGALFEGRCRMTSRATPAAAAEEEEGESPDIDYEAEAKRLFSMAVGLFEEGDYGEAILLFRRVQQLGRAHAEEAQAYLIRLAGWWDQVRFDEGVNCLRARRYADARLCFLDVADLSGEHHAEAEFYLSKLEPTELWHRERAPRGYQIGGEEGGEEGGEPAYMSFNLDLIGDLLSDAIAVPVEPAATTTVRRTPHLDVLPNEPVQPGTELHVFVYLDTLALREGEEGEGAAFETEKGGGPLEVDTHLILTKHFSNRGEAVKTLVVNPQKERTEPVRFDVKVNEERELTAAGLFSVPAQITALFLLNGRPSGSIRRAVQVSGIALFRPQLAEEDA